MGNQTRIRLAICLLFIAILGVFAHPASATPRRELDPEIYSHHLRDM
jgi:hypothetical protein